MSGGDGYLTNPLYREIAKLMTDAGITHRVEQGAKHFHVKFMHLGVERTQILHLGPNNKGSTYRKTVIRFRKIVAAERAYVAPQLSPELNLEQPVMSEPACAMSPIYKLISSTLTKHGVAFTVDPRPGHDRLIVACRTGERAITIHRTAKPHQRSINKAESWLASVLSDRRFPTVEDAHAELKAQVELDIDPPPAHVASLSYDGFVIGQSGDMISLTDMWKAAGGPEGKQPAQWSRTDLANEFIEFVAGNLKCADSHIFGSKAGRGGGTFAHWQIAIAYAKYLSPRFHMWANDAVREKMERMRAAPAIEAPAPRSEVVVFDPQPVTSGVIGGLIRYFKDHVVGPINRMVGTLSRIEDRSDSLHAVVARNQGWLEARFDAMNERDREVLHLLRYQNGGDPTKRMDVVGKPDLVGYVDVHAVYALAGVTGKIPNRGLLSSIVPASLTAFCRDNPPYSTRSRPGRGSEKIAVWPKTAVLEWLANGGREMIERHLRTHAGKPNLVSITQP